MNPPIRCTRNGLGRHANEHLRKTRWVRDDYGNLKRVQYKPMKSKLTMPETVSRLFKFMKERHPLGIAAISPLPNWVADGPGGKPTMSSMRGLIKRGLVSENANGIFYLTEKGIAQEVDDQTKGTK